MTRRVYIRFYGFQKVYLSPLGNRKTFTFIFGGRYHSSPSLYLAKEVIYRDCFGRLRSKIIAVRSINLYMALSPFDIIEQKKKLVKEYEESRLKNRVYLKNYKKAING
jgi:hypothetical protein